jgi:hypothetical protein
LRRVAPLLAVVLLAAPATASAAVRSELDRQGGVRLTLDGAALTAEIVVTPHFHRSPTTEEQLYGQRVAGACGTSFRPLRRTFVFERRVWPAGVRRLTFGFGRDISRRARWCVLEGADGGDVAFVSFVDRERARLAAKGRGPSGEWWRLWAYRGEMMEPCMRLRTGAGAPRAFLPCFGDFAEREATLAAEHQTIADRYVYGPVGRSATAVRVRLADGSVELADLYDRPPGSRAMASYFMLVLPREGPAVVGVRALDADGQTIGRDAVERYERN